MNYDAQKAIAELETAITMIRFGMFGTAKENIGHAVSYLAKAGTIHNVAQESNDNE